LASSLRAQSLRLHLPQLSHHGQVLGSIDTGYRDELAAGPDAPIYLGMPAVADCGPRRCAPHIPAQAAGVFRLGEAIHRGVLIAASMQCRQFDSTHRKELNDCDLVVLRIPGESFARPLNRPIVTQSTAEGSR